MAQSSVLDLELPGQIVVLSDIHGNATALRAVRDLLRQRSFSQLIILGDLLTYGCHPLAVLELIEELLIEYPTILIQGNHDQLYLDLSQGNTHYYDTLPDWLKEAVDWTWQQLDPVHLQRMKNYPWTKQYCIGNSLFAHANPFEYGDWTYLNRISDFQRAFTALNAFQQSIGVFGHTHRPVIAVKRVSGEIELENQSTTFNQCDSSIHALILNPGSVGQPRHANRCSTFLTLASSTDTLAVQFERIVYDLEIHLQSIQSSTLSDSTKAKLLGYLI